MKNSYKKLSFLLIFLSVLSLQKPAHAGFLESVCNIFGCKQQSIEGVKTAPKPKQKHIIANHKLATINKFQGSSHPAECGPFSVYRLLKFYGYNHANLDRIVSRRESIMRSQSDIKFIDRSKFGSTPSVIRTLISDYTKNRGKIGVVTNGSFQGMKNILMQDTPVIALVRNGTIKKGVTVPSLHYIMVVGFDDFTKYVHYYDTIDNYVRSVPYNKFLRRTAGSGWADAPTWTWSVGPGVVKETLQRTIGGSRVFIWIKEKPILGQVGPIQTTPSNQPNLSDSCSFGSNCGGRGSYGRDRNGKEIPVFNLGQ